MQYPVVGTTQACIDIKEKLTQFPMAKSGCTIYRVHRHLREINEKAYEPRMIAIGPYHHDKEHLKMFQEHKLRYFHLLLQRTNGNVETYTSAIGELEDKARKCYAESIDLNSSKFIEMMVLDGCFIIELLHKFIVKELREEKDPIFNMNWMLNSLQRDMMLFENQIPFFILCKLFDLIHQGPDNHNMLMGHVGLFFFTLFQNNISNLNQEIDLNSNPDKIKHLLDFIHCLWLPSSPEILSLGESKKDTAKEFQFIKNATALVDANVMFKKKTGTTLFDVSFQNGTLLLPPLGIEEWTESFFRNLIAYEEYSYHDIPYSFVTDYVKFMDCLINSSRDVEILSNCGIVKNCLGDDEVVANMFNKLMDSVAGLGSGFVYLTIFDSMNVHCNKSRNKWMAKLRSNYLNSPWAVISIIAAAILLFLTVIQTICTILQVVL